MKAAASMQRDPFLVASIISILKKYYIYIQLRKWQRQIGKFLENSNGVGVGWKKYTNTICWASSLFQAWVTIVNVLLIPIFASFCIPALDSVALQLLLVEVGTVPSSLMLGLPSGLLPLIECYQMWCEQTLGWACAVGHVLWCSVIVMRVGLS